MYCPQCGNENKTSAKFCMKCGASLLELDEKSKTPGKKKIKEIEAGFVLDGRYKIIDIIERGGMGAVYRANDMRLDIVCAIKEMRENFERDEYRIYAIEKFKSEALILSKLRHPNIPRVSDYFIQNNRYYLTMDYIEGETLFKIVNRRPRKRVDEDELVEWTLQLCDVLSYLHHQDPPIIYRDIKPANVMITPENRVFLIDFGIARIFNPQAKGTMIGTQGYSPPEQYRGRVDPRSDIYALGATMHHLVTGRDPQLDAPFSFPPVRDLMSKVSEEVAFVIDKCLKFNPGHRFDNVDEMRDMLELRGTGALDLSDALATIKGRKRVPSYKPDKEISKIQKEDGKKLASELENLLVNIDAPGENEDAPPVGVVPHQVPPVKGEVAEDIPGEPAESPAPQKPPGPVSIKPQLKKISQGKVEEIQKGSLKIDESKRANQLFDKIKSGSLKKNGQKEDTPVPEDEPPRDVKPRRFPTVPFGPVGISISKIASKITPRARATPPDPVEQTPPGADEFPNDEQVRALFEEPLEGPKKHRLKKKKKPRQMAPGDEPAVDDGFTIPAMLGQGTDTSVMEKAEDTREIPNVSGQLRDTFVKKQSSLPPAKVEAKADNNNRKIPPAKKSSGTRGRSQWFMFRGKPSHSGENRKAPPVRGALRWRFRSSGRIYSSATVDSAGNIFFGSNDGCLYCVTPEGKENWRFVTDGAVYSTPLIIEGEGIFFGSEDSHIYGVDFDGKGLWRTRLGGEINSSPALGHNGTVIFGCNDGNLYCVNAMGQERWRFTVNNFINSSPCVGPDENIYFGSWDKFLYALSPGGKLLWNYKAGGSIDSSPAIDGAGCIYFGCDDGFLYSLDHIGTLRWRFRTGDKIYSSPAIDRERGIFFGSHDNYFYNLTFDGKLRWKLLTNYWVRSSPSIDSLGNVYTGCDDFSLYSISPDGNVNWKFKTNGSVEACPCITPTGLVVGSNDGWLYALE